ncbi:unnamed protein product [Moneuplotes crassus]|uniref:ABC transporter domain-containing protein n=1 Tax=Euplotes crassus TaxID=5936 RepID=A0AAD1Y602_EUPCR|nr:unnamed protein product [Moneuplotes crassus]
MLLFTLCRKSFSLQYSKCFLILQFLLIVAVFFFYLFMFLIFQLIEIPEEQYLERGYQWGPQEIFGYKSFNEDSDEWFRFCHDRPIKRSIIALAPEGDPTIGIVKRIVQQEVKKFNLTVNTYENREVLWDLLKEQKEGICFGAFLPTADYQSNEYKLHLIFNDRDSVGSFDSNIPDQRDPAYNPNKNSIDLASFNKYKNGGYSYMQNVFSNAILKTISGEESSISMAIVLMKSAAMTENLFLEGSGGFFAFCVTLVFLPSAFALVYYTVEEKRSKIRELMSIMGMKDSIYWSSWFLYYFIVTTIQCLFVTSVLITVFTPMTLLFIFLYLWLFGIWIFGFSVFIGSMFPSGKAAAFSAVTLLFIISMSTKYYETEQITEVPKIFVSLIPPLGIIFASNNIVTLESNGVGVQFSNIGETIDDYKLITYYWMTLVSTVLFTCLGLYLEKILPTSPGVRKSICFPFKKSYWFGHRRRAFNRSQLNSSTQRLLSRAEHQLEYLRESYFEPPTEEEIMKKNNDQCILIENLFKEYGNDKAVRNLTAEMYEGQIFALLGHNGAGKSTIVNVLSGMVAFSQGNGYIYGHDIRTEMGNIRKILSICPQKSILFPGMTLIDHLYIFAELKGKSRSEVGSEIKELLYDLRLEPYKERYCQELSEEIQRKLSLAISLVGGSKVVFLDEPSSCMDLGSRKEMWEILHKYKTNRIIILITHYMEEADYLGDKIGIMSHGQMICSGSARFLKGKFGEGYNLHFIKEQRDVNQPLENFMKEHFPYSKKVSEVSHELVYLLPKRFESNFPEFFQKLDENLETLGVSSYEISMTTLEEVFLKIEKEAESLQENQEIHQELSDTELYPKEYNIRDQSTKKKWDTFLSHLGILFCKRLKLTSRSFSSIMLDILLPILLVTMGIMAFNSMKYFDSPERKLDPSLFPKPQRIIYNDRLINGNGSPDEIVKLMPGFGEFIASQPIRASITDDISTLESFDNQIYQLRVEEPVEPYRYGSYYFHTLDTTNNVYKVVTLVNSTSQDSSVAFTHFMYQAILRKASGDDNLKFTATTSPMPINKRFKENSKKEKSLYITSTLTLGITVIIINTLNFLLKEKTERIFHYQRLNGMNKDTYWVSNFIFDTAKIYTAFALIYTLFKAFSLQIDYIGVLLFLSPVPIVAYSYVVTLAFKNQVTANNFIFIFNFVVCGVCPFIANNYSIQEEDWVYRIAMTWTLRIFPSYCLIDGVDNLLLKEYIGYYNNLDKSPSAFSARVAGPDLLFLLFHFFFWIILLYMIQRKSWKCNCKRNNKKVILKPRYKSRDVEIINEQNRVHKIPSDSLAVKFDKCQAIINQKVLLNEISLAVGHGDCYCLLGINGAGKSITLKMLVGQTPIASGKCYVEGYNIKHELMKVRNKIGYCPQSNPIFESFTVSEHLEYYAKLKGIPKEFLKKSIKDIMRGLNLDLYKHKRAWKLSEGNKRKLSVAIALIGGPPVLLLDEPSSGMDPQSKRLMWEIITQINNGDEKASVIFTTHSMEEAETLSTNMGILVDGQIKCFGSKQDIKEKFRTEYQIEVRYNELTDIEVDELIEIHKIMDYLEKYCSNLYKTVDDNQRSLQITDEACRGILAKIFENDFAEQEFTTKGLGREIRFLLEDNKYYSLYSLIRWQDYMFKVKKSIDYFVQRFGETSLVEEVLPKCRFRIPRMGKPIGYFFNLMEQEKENLEISEYSISQANLEQIFSIYAGKRSVKYVGKRYRSSQLDRKSPSFPKEEFKKEKSADFEAGFLETP